MQARRTSGPLSLSGADQLTAQASLEAQTAGRVAAVQEDLQQLLAQGRRRQSRSRSPLQSSRQSATDRGRTSRSSAGVREWISPVREATAGTAGENRSQHQHERDDGAAAAPTVSVLRTDFLADLPCCCRSLLCCGAGSEQSDASLQSNSLRLLGDDEKGGRRGGKTTARGRPEAEAGDCVGFARQLCRAALSSRSKQAGTSGGSQTLKAALLPPAAAKTAVRPLPPRCAASRTQPAAAR